MSVPTASSLAASLYRQYGPVVYRRCLALLEDREAARDATQEVFARLVRQLPELSELGDRAAVLGWVCRSATNHCLGPSRRGARPSRPGAARRPERFLDGARQYLGESQ